MAVNDIDHNRVASIRGLSQEDFFELEEKVKSSYRKQDFAMSSEYFIGCALDPEMGEDYQDTLYKINRLSKKWLVSKDFASLSKILPDLEGYLREKHSNEQAVRAKILKSPVVSKNVNEQGALRADEVNAMNLEPRLRKMGENPRQDRKAIEHPLRTALVS
jgi:hypothetical protein